MSLRDYEGWRRYAKWKRENRDAWESSIKKKEVHRNTIHKPKQMSDGLTEAYKGAKYQSHKKIPTVKHIDQMPDQKWHRIISFIKSGIRIVGYCFIPFNLLTASILLITSEIVGIFEELV
jgi:hypothetical protein